MKKRILLLTLLGIGLINTKTVKAQCPNTGIDPVAICQNFTVVLDASGNGILTANDIDGGSTDDCGITSMTVSQATFNCADIGVGGAANDLVISAAYDGPLTGGLPKGIELYVINNIADLSLYGVGSANNGGGTDGEEFTFPTVSVSAGTYIYAASDSAKFNDWFGFDADYVTGTANINGDDAVELFFNNAVIDVFGDIAVDGTNQPWEYLDGWAYRNNSTGPDGSTFVLGNWSFSGKNALDGESTNALAVTPIPVGTYTPPLVGISVILTVTDGEGNTDNCTAIVPVVDNIAPVLTCLGNQTAIAVAACQFALPDFTVAASVSATDNCTASSTITQSPAVGALVGLGVTVVTLTADDGNGNTTSCNFDLTVSSNAIGSQNLTECAGFSITINGNTYTTTGIYIDVLVGAAANGCDSTLTTDLTVLPTLTGVHNETVCDGGSIAVNGTTYDVSNLTGTEVFTNIGASNCDSTVLVTLTILPALTGTITQTICAGESIVVNAAVYNTTIIGAIETFTNIGVNNCDSVVTINLTVEPAIDVSVINASPILTANQTGATYQWLDCGNANTPIALATNQSYTATGNGNYAVEITLNNCVDTSVCETVSNVGINENNLSNEAIIYPNPTSGLFTVSLIDLEKNTSVTVYSVVGKEVVHQQITKSKTTINLSPYNKGIYFVKIQNGDNVRIKRIVKQ